MISEARKVVVSIWFVYTVGELPASLDFWYRQATYRRGCICRKCCELAFKSWAVSGLPQSLRKG